MWYYNPSTGNLDFKKSTPVISGSPAQINAQTLFQDWILSSGTLLVFSFIDTGSFIFEISPGAIVEIN